MERDLLLSQRLLPPYVRSLLASSSFNKTVLQCTEHSDNVKQSIAIATRLRCDGIFSDYFIANLLLKVTVKNFEHRSYLMKGMSMVVWVL